MEITLNMRIQDQDIALKANLTNHAGRIYRQQYSRDIMRDMSAIYKKQHRSPFEGIDMSGIKLNGVSEQEIYEQILAKVDVTKMLSDQTESALDFEDMEIGGQIIWAFVKNANKDTPNYEKWIDSFDFILPVGDIVSALYEAWTRSATPTVELKN